jgi:serine phosphatase RsbU (regulator of sigma subunit)/pSer/pThr/pTyr-binding forkhead associated (FHA) protein
MASLHIVKTPGSNQGTVLPLEVDRFILGRNPDCGVVIPVTSVSREHAQIVRIQGRFHIEDLQSRNGTFVNNQAISNRVTLRDGDKIRICDFLAIFLETSTTDDDGGDGAVPPVEATLSHSSGLMLELQPAEKLRSLLEISGILSKTLDLNELLPKIVDCLFHLFKQADRAFLILAEDQPRRLLPKVVKTRRQQDETSARFSRSIVNKCLETSQAFLSDDASQDNRLSTSQSVADFRIRSVMCAPMVTGEGKPFGVIQLDTQDRAKKFTKSDLELLCGVANQAAIALDNVRMHQEAVEQERVKRDLQLANEVLMTCLPQKQPELPGYDFHAFYRPAYLVGGDYYDFIPLPPHRLLMALGDVAGKGMPAALLVTKLTSEARYSFLREPDAARAISSLNDLLAPQCSRTDRFITLCGAVLDPTTHTVTFANAGHPSPVLVRAASGTVEECVPKRIGGLALGITEGYPYASCQVQLQPGDAIVIYSDGVSDAENIRDEQFGTPAILSTLKAVGSTAPKALIEGLMKAVEKHTAGAKQNDDITLAALARTA